MSDPIMEAKEMEGETPDSQAKKATSYALRIIHDNPQVGWHMGAGTQSFALLTEAFATLMGREVAAVRKMYAPQFSGLVDTLIVRLVRSALEDYQVNATRYNAATASAALVEVLTCIFKEAGK